MGLSLFSCYVPDVLLYLSLQVCVCSFGVYILQRALRFKMRKLKVKVML